jgi:hypothetical protein
MVFSEGFLELKKLRENTQLPLFFTPREAALATAYLIQRYRYLNSKKDKK